MQKLIDIFLAWCKARENRQKAQAYRDGFFWAIDEYCFYQSSIQEIHLECEVAVIKLKAEKYYGYLQEDMIDGAKDAIAFITHGLIPDQLNR